MDNIKEEKATDDRLVESNDENTTDHSRIQMRIEEFKSSKIELYLGLLSLIISIFFIFQGRDKLINYSSDPSKGLKNAYVNADAYNFIINGTHATSFFVLAMGFLITGTILILYYRKNKYK